MPFMIITSLFSILGIVVVESVLSHSSTTDSGLFTFMALSIMMGGSSLISFFVQWIMARRRMNHLIRVYQKKLQEIEQRLQVLQWKEQQACFDLNPPFLPPADHFAAFEQVTIMPLIQRTLTDQDVGLWVRRQTDPDFLQVRIGIGKQPATFKLRSSQLENKISLPNRLDRSNAFALALLTRYEMLDVPCTIKLDSSSPVALIGSQQHLSSTRELARAIVSQLAYHHSPEDVRVIILAPASQAALWQWAGMLPHTVMYDPRRVGEGTGEEGMEVPRALAFGGEAIINLLPFISRELGRRELLLSDARPAPILAHQQPKAGLLPHLVIVVDHFDPLCDLDETTVSLPIISSGQTISQTLTRSRLAVSPLKRPELTLPLSRNQMLGVSMLCICGNIADVPTTSATLIDLNVPAVPAALFSPQTLAPLALIRRLQPDPPPLISCSQLDRAPVEALHYFAQRMQPLHMSSTKRLEIRPHVDLRELFEPPIDLQSYNPLVRWGDPIFRMLTDKGEVPNMRIPIGLKIADEVQYLDFLKDGPHGLMIGQTGSGKSELLQTIITSLAVVYQPTEVNFLLIDYKAGLALEPFRALPHTIGFLSNVSSPALIQRFIIMLKAEATRREVALKKGAKLPRLVIIIDEFAEMAKRTESVLDELFTITRVGREIGMHLLLAAQRPEGIIGSKVRDYVQYRLCLRCASPEDSREVLRRPDAANLPASIPGRTYLLHGDNQLDLFQAGRVALMLTLNASGQLLRPPISLLSVTQSAVTTTLAEALIKSIRKAFSYEEVQQSQISYWPDPLPTPVSHQFPDPLTLLHNDPGEYAFESMDTMTGSRQKEASQHRLSVVAMTFSQMVAIRGKTAAKPFMQIPLGLIDKPEIQQREIFLADLHGSAGALTGGPLFLAGAQHSGKATALEALCLWLFVCYLPHQLRLAMIDPTQEFDFLQEMPYLQDSAGESLWSDGSTDEKLNNVAERMLEIISKRRSDFPRQRWDDNTIAQMWARGVEMPLVLIVINHYHSFAERLNAMGTLKKLVLAAAEARNMGVYLVVTSNEVGGRYVSADLLNKFATKIGLFLNEQQRFDLFGRTPLIPDLTPGRGLVQTPDRSIHQIQFALPVAGNTDRERRETLKQRLQTLRDRV